MTSNRALSTCRLILKQITPEDLVEDGRAAMNTCFTGFTEPLLPDDEYVRQGQDLAAKRFGNIDVLMESDLSTGATIGASPGVKS